MWGMPHAGGEPRETRRTQRRRLHVLKPFNRGVQHVRLILQRRAGKMCPGRAPGQPDYGTTRVRLPVRRAESLERVDRSANDVAGDRRENTFDTTRPPPARVQQEERSGVVRVPGRARVPSALTVQRSLLIASHSHDGDRRAEHLGGRLTERTG